MSIRCLPEWVHLNQTLASPQVSRLANNAVDRVGKAVWRALLYASRVDLLPTGVTGVTECDETPRFGHPESENAPGTENGV